MKLWEIKAQALRLMFADTDLEFNEDDFTSGTVYNNPNTREKLNRMEDSIRRAIDTYYAYVGEERRETIIGLKTQIDGAETIYFNKLDISGIDYFGEPTRVDVLFYDNDGNYVHEVRQLGFMFHKWNSEILFLEDKFDHLEDNVEFRVYYKLQKLNLPFSNDEMTYDLDDIFIPTNVQQHIPHHIKGELYEEDEPSQAQYSRQLFMQFLLSLEKTSIIQKRKIRRSNVFTNRGV